jgi:predicted nucleic acid-binding protein
MRYLLDTCVLSELIKSKPEPNVINWISSQRESDLFISVLTVGELLKGISKLPDSKKKNRLKQWLENDLLRRFGGRILKIDTKTTSMWGKLIGEKEKIGIKIPVIDGLLATTALSNDLVLVTRNTKDFQATECELLNPWE